jgi:hypothetical protein
MDLVAEVAVGVGGEADLEPFFFAVFLANMRHFGGLGMLFEMLN